jgi:hypothetical protein
VFVIILDISLPEGKSINPVFKNRKIYRSAGSGHRALHHHEGIQLVAVGIAKIGRVKAVPARSGRSLTGPAVGQGDVIGMKTDSAGLYVFKNLKPAVYNLQFSLVGYQKKMQFDVQLSNARPTVFRLAQEISLKTTKSKRILFHRAITNVPYGYAWSCGSIRNA